jgi:hypothetical protein
MSMEMTHDEIAIYIRTPAFRCRLDALMARMRRGPAMTVSEASQILGLPYQVFATVLVETLLNLDDPIEINFPSKRETKLLCKGETNGSFDDIGAAVGGDAGAHFRRNAGGRGRAD